MTPPSSGRSWSPDSVGLTSWTNCSQRGRKTMAAKKPMAARNVAAMVTA